ncbi:hypothetical protein BLA29_003488 [Euroglyphus maynei]|uniref:SCP domain-containing protein n=1 Tax=Euroglyphus maynei TaxID=6958 RepID=A0A1Y3B4B5_EURMA|nr:hypothetical protein BLA29_003488 [Euroglyphus maynei]
MNKSTETDGEEKRFREYYEQDGTKVIETITLCRIPPKGGLFSGTNLLEVDSNFYHQVLDYTNELRAKHQAPPLALFRDLNKFAQEWANHLAKLNQCIHRDQTKYGENIYYKYQYSKITLNGYEPVQSWYDEIEDYYPFFGKDPPKSIFNKVGHFTNLVWKETKRMGVGYAKGTNTVYVVANYDPPGNLFTAFKDNVLPPVVTETITSSRISAALIKESSMAPSSGRSILEVDKNFQQQVLDYTNELRAKHQVSSITLHPTLNKYAQDWADHLARINKCVPREQSKFGENLFSKSHDAKITLNGIETVQSWYNEIEEYFPYFGKEPPKTLHPKICHLANLIWKDTKRMGVGYAKGTNTVYVVCYYDPRGGITDSFKDQMLPPKEMECSTTCRIVPKEKEDLKLAPTNVLEVDPKFYQQFLDYTNELRAKHQAPPLSFYKDLQRYAQEWAIHLAKINQCMPREQSKFGENLFYKSHYSKITLNGFEPVQSWYNEIEEYYPFFGKEPPKTIFAKIGHFTNLVWKQTKRMGVGYAKSANTVYVVCNYDPPGNIFNQFKDNVLSPLPGSDQKDKHGQNLQKTNTTPSSSQA